MVVQVYMLLPGVVVVVEVLIRQHLVWLVPPVVLGSGSGTVAVQPSIWTKYDCLKKMQHGCVC
jgi:hypothetical protein